MTSILSAEQHKLKGNELFKFKAYDEAIHEYSTAIVKDPKVAVYYCNRANCYLKLERYSSVLADCERVIELDPKSVKGYYFMGKAELELGHPSEAYALLKRSYELALEQRSAFTKDIVAMISDAKKQKWIEEERRKLSQVSETYHYLSNLVKQDIQHQMNALDKSASDYEDNMAYLRSERDERLGQLETMMQRAGTPDDYIKPYIHYKERTPPSGFISPEASPRPLPETLADGDTEMQGPAQEQREKQSHQGKQHAVEGKQAGSPFQVKEVPDYFLDKITFEFMHDPVISTKSGISYERSTLLEHFSYGRMFDPVAQVPLTERDIVPNRALKEACDEFLSKNGWAVDY